jgi:phage anti-repressor protein
LGRTEEEWKLISKYQKQFPMLSIIESKDKHPIDGEELCNALEVKDDYTTWLLADWKSKQGKLIKYGFVLDKDYFAKSRSEIMEKTRSAKSRSEIKLHGGQNKKVVKLTTSCAKKVAMKQNNSAGDLVADYFILMELIIKDYEKWIIVRHPEIEGYNQLMKALSKQYILEHGHKSSDTKMYSQEGDMLNICLLGARAKEIRKILDAEDNHTREYLSIQVNQALYELQIFDIGLISSNVEFEKRQGMIKNMCETRYKYITLEAPEVLKTAV